MVTIEQLMLVAGLGSSGYLLTMIVWSIAFPAKRLWPPIYPTQFRKVLVWLLTTTIFVSVFVLGIRDWNSFDWPTLVRWSLGLPLIMLGNLVVWRGVRELGLKATSGEAQELVTAGVYRYSRNPQYVADMAILLGWQICCASVLTVPVVLAGVLVLLIAPLAEEPWLRATYGKEYDLYRLRTRRYL